MKRTIEYIIKFNRHSQAVNGWLIYGENIPDNVVTTGWIKPLDVMQRFLHIKKYMTAQGFSVSLKREFA